MNALTASIIFGVNNTNQLISSMSQAIFPATRLSHCGLLLYFCLQFNLDHVSNKTDLYTVMIWKEFSRVLDFFYINQTQLLL